MFTVPLLRQKAFPLPCPPSSCHPVCALHLSCIYSTKPRGNLESRRDENLRISCSRRPVILWQTGRRHRRNPYYWNENSCVSTYKELKWFLEERYFPVMAHCEGLFHIFALEDIAVLVVLLTSPFTWFPPMLLPLSDNIIKLLCWALHRKYHHHHIVALHVQLWVNLIVNFISKKSKNIQLFHWRLFSRWDVSQVVVNVTRAVAVVTWVDPLSEHCWPQLLTLCESYGWHDSDLATVGCVVTFSIFFTHEIIFKYALRSAQRSPKAGLFVFLQWTCIMLMWK